MGMQLQSSRAVKVVGRLDRFLSYRERRESLVQRPLRKDPRRFGRARLIRNEDAVPTGSRLKDDISLFATTFAAGFLFVAVLIA